MLATGAEWGSPYIRPNLHWHVVNYVQSRIQLSHSTKKINRYRVMLWVWYQFILVNHDIKPLYPFFNQTWMAFFWVCFIVGSFPAFSDGYHSPPFMFRNPLSSLPADIWSFLKKHKQQHVTIHATETLMIQQNHKSQWISDRIWEWRWELSGGRSLRWEASFSCWWLRCSSISFFCNSSCYVKQRLFLKAQTQQREVEGSPPEFLESNLWLKWSRLSSCLLSLFYYFFVKNVENNWWIE